MGSAASRTEADISSSTGFRPDALDATSTSPVVTSNPKSPSDATSTTIDEAPDLLMTEDQSDGLEAEGIKGLVFSDSEVPPDAVIKTGNEVVSPSNSAFPFSSPYTISNKASLASNSGTPSTATTSTGSTAHVPSDAVPSNAQTRSNNPEPFILPPHTFPLNISGSTSPNVTQHNINSILSRVQLHRQLRPSDGEISKTVLETLRVLRTRAEYPRATDIEYAAATFFQNHDLTLQLCLEDMIAMMEIWEQGDWTRDELQGLVTVVRECNYLLGFLHSFDHDRQGSLLNVVLRRKARVLLKKGVWSGWSYDLRWRLGWIVSEENDERAFEMAHPLVSSYGLSG